MAYFCNFSFIVAIVFVALFGFNFGEEIYSNGGQDVFVADYRDADLSKASNLQDQQEKFDELVNMWFPFNNNRFTSALHSYARDLCENKVIKLLSSLKELHIWMQLTALFNLDRMQEYFAANHPEVFRYESLPQFFRQKVQTALLLKTTSEHQLQSFCEYFEHCDDMILTNTEASARAPILFHDNFNSTMEARNYFLHGMKNLENE